jgi:predicted KAP-like P-loop ATPase
MWADTETETDFLNYSEVAELIAEMIATPDLLPISLGVFGGWGVGKSSTLRLVERELSKAGSTYLVIRFDAWLYQDFDNARTALMSVIADELFRAAPPGLKEKAKGLFSRINKLRALGLIVEGGALAMGVPTFGLLARGLEGIADVISGDAGSEDVDSIEKGAAEAVQKTKGLLKDAKDREPPQEIAAFRTEFGEVLAGLDKTLVVFIDNLDRCLPENAIHTLEAVRLFLFMPKTAFVIAADEDMIRHAVARHFHDPGERHVADYLDKLIQMPVRVPRLGVQEVRAYLFLLLCGVAVTDAAIREQLRKYLIESLQQSWKADGAIKIDDVLGIIGKGADETLRQSLEMADRMAPMLAHATRVQGNPRTVKRLLNVVRMRASIAGKRKMPLDEAIIAKMALFERCTDITATEALHDAINAATNGRPELFTDQTERADNDDRKHWPDAWQKHASFVAEWLSLEPKLAGVDLRPAVYLARETVPLRIAATSVSPRALKAVEILVHTATISSRAAIESIATLETGEDVVAMEELISQMRKNVDWTRARADFRGAVLLARASAEAGKVLGRFVRALPTQPIWMSSLTKDDTWMKG